MYVKLDQSIVIVGEGAWAGLLMLMYFSIQPGISVAEEVARIAHCSDNRDTAHTRPWLRGTITSKGQYLEQLVNTQRNNTNITPSTPCTM